MAPFILDIQAHSLSVKFFIFWNRICDMNRWKENKKNWLQLLNFSCYFQLMSSLDFYSPPLKFPRNLHINFDYHFQLQQFIYLYNFLPFSKELAIKSIKALSYRILRSTKFTLGSNSVLIHKMWFVQSKISTRVRLTLLLAVF